jgi:hypothetical protein
MRVLRTQFTNKPLVLSGFVLLFLLLTRPARSQANAQVPQPLVSAGDEQPVKSKAKFRMKAAGEGMTRGIAFGFEDYDSSAGVYAMYLYGRLDNAAKAKQYFDIEIAYAAKVIKRSELKSNKAGGGERAVIVLPPEEGQPKTVYAIIRDDGGHFTEFRSASLKVALELEKFLNE